MKLHRLLSLIAALCAAVASSAFLSRQKDNPEADAFAMRSWLSSHLKDEFEMDSDGRLREQSGHNIPWDWKETRPRNAKNDCGDEPGSVVKKVTDDMAKAAKAGELAAG